MQALTFQAIQKMGGEIAPQRAKPVVRVARDGAQIREELVASGVLRPAGTTPAVSAPQHTVFAIDDAGLRDAAVSILFRAEERSPARLAAILEECDERLRDPLRSLAARHGMRIDA